MPLELTKRDAKRLTLNRRMLQPPGPSDVAPPFAAMSMEGIPGDVLFTLEALRQLAEQGNQVAQMLYDRERDRLGIDRPTTIILPG